jgi:hypothetical protein
LVFLLSFALLCNIIYIQELVNTHLWTTGACLESHRNPCLAGRQAKFRQIRGKSGEDE